MLELTETPGGYRLFDPQFGCDLFFSADGQSTGSLHVCEQLLTGYMDDRGPSGPMPHLPIHERIAERLQSEPITHFSFPRVSAPLAQLLRTLNFTAQDPQHRFLTRNTSGTPLLSADQYTVVTTQLQPLTTAALALELPAVTPLETAANQIIRHLGAYAYTKALPDTLRQAQAFQQRRHLLSDALEALQISALNDEPHPQRSAWLWSTGHHLTRADPLRSLNALRRPELQQYIPELRRWRAALAPHVTPDATCAAEALAALRDVINVTRPAL